MPKRFSARPTRAIRQSTEAIKGQEALVTQAQQGNKPARDKILLSWLPWIEDQARLYAHRAQRLDLIEDLQQTAICGAGPTLGGLMRALETYDDSKGSAFHSHAIYYINAAFMELLAKSVPGMTVGTFKRTERIRTIAHDFKAAFKKDASVRDIRRAGGNSVNSISDSRIEDALSTTPEPKTHALNPATNSFHYDYSVVEPTQESAVAARQELRRLKSILDAAKPRDRLCYVQNVINGASIDEIMAETKLNFWQVYRAIKRVKDKVAS